MKGIADLFVSQGLEADGYTYVNLDDCWAEDGPAQLTAPLTGAYELALQASDGGDGSSFDHADWAAPELTCV